MEIMISHQKQISDELVEIMHKQRLLESLTNVESEFEAVKNNLEGLYFKIKTELWAYKLDIQIFPITDHKLAIQITYKDKVNFRILLRSKSTPYESQLLSIEVESFPGVSKEQINSYIHEAIKEGDFVVFLKRIQDDLMQWNTECIS